MAGLAKNNSTEHPATTRCIIVDDVPACPHRCSCTWTLEQYRELIEPFWRPVRPWRTGDRPNVRTQRHSPAAAVSRTSTVATAHTSTSHTTQAAQRPTHRRNS